jgi:hypothetical protein
LNGTGALNLVREAQLRTLLFEVAHAARLIAYTRFLIFLAA